MRAEGEAWLLSRCLGWDSEKVRQKAHSVRCPTGDLQKVHEQLPEPHHNISYDRFKACKRIRISTCLPPILRNKTYQSYTKPKITNMSLNIISLNNIEWDNVFFYFLSKRSKDVCVFQLTNLLRGNRVHWVSFNIVIRFLYVSPVYVCVYYFLILYWEFIQTIARFRIVFTFPKAVLKALSIILLRVPYRINSWFTYFL